MEIKQTLNSVKDYPNSKKFRLQVMNGHHETMKNLQNVICQVIKDPTAQPIQKFLAVKLAKDTIEVFNDEFISELQKTLLPLLEKIALFKVGNNDPDRGSTIFNQFQPSKDEILIGNSFFRLVLECLFVWSRWFPIDPDTSKLSQYKLCYEKLVRQKVHFSKVEGYFKFADIKKHMPEQMIPIDMLNECKSIILSDLQKQGNQDNQEQNRTKNRGSPTSILSQQLTLTLKHCLHSYSFFKDIFYTDILIRCKNKVKKLIKEKQKFSKNEYSHTTQKSLKKTNEVKQLYQMDVMRLPNLNISRNVIQSGNSMQIYSIINSYKEVQVQILDSYQPVYLQEQVLEYLFQVFDQLVLNHPNFFQANDVKSYQFTILFKFIASPRNINQPISYQKYF